MPDVQKITTCLWFDGNAEEAAAFYCSLFDDSRIVEVQRYTEAGPGRPGDVVYLVFELAGQQFSAINGGPQFRFTEAISLMVACEDQAEVPQSVLAVNRPAVALSTVTVAAAAGPAGPRRTSEAATTTANQRWTIFMGTSLGGLGN